MFRFCFGPGFRRALLPLALLLALLAAPAARAQAPRPAGGTHYLYLIRHGIYDRDDKGDDVTGNGLNALGHEQAKLIGARLAAMPVRPALLVSSTLRRARETAEDMALLLGMTPQRDSLLSECTPTSDRPDYMKNHPPGEISQCDARLAAAWAKYVTPSPDADRHDVLVCHGNVIRWFVSKVVAGDPLRWGWMDIGNASLTVLAVRPDGTASLVMYSDVGHLPVDKQTWSGRGAGWGLPHPGRR